MIAQHKLLRVLRLITLLKATPRHNISQLAKILEMSERTLYRYITLLEEVGYITDKDFDGNIFILTDEEQTGEVLFSPEETALLRDLLLGASPGHLLTDTILKKLYLNSELMPFLITS